MNGHSLRRCQGGPESPAEVGDLFSNCKRSQKLTFLLQWWFFLERSPLPPSSGELGMAFGHPKWMVTPSEDVKVAQNHVLKLVIYFLTVKWLFLSKMIYFFGIHYLASHKELGDVVLFLDWPNRGLWNPKSTAQLAFMKVHFLVSDHGNFQWGAVRRRTWSERQPQCRISNESCTQTLWIWVFTHVKVPKKKLK